MRHPPRRTAALIAIISGPAIALLASLLLATAGPIHAIADGPLEGGGYAARSRGWLEFSGFYPAEVEAGRSFSWMGTAGRVRLPRIDRSDRHTLSLRAQPAVIDQPVDLVATVDGLAPVVTRLVPGAQRIDIDIPPSRTNRAVVSLAVSATRVPGGGDARTLGLRADGIGLEAADGRLRIPASSMRAAAIAGLGLGVALAVTLGARPLAIALGLGVGAWIGFLLTFDGSFLGPYADRVQAVGVCAAGASVLAAAALRRDAAERWGPRAAAGVVVVLTACKLALFLHPMATIGDSIFHVHRAQVVQRGEYFFTSITPRPFFEFPYPPGLYVAVAPFWEAFRSDLEHVWLLRTAVIVAEAGLALAVYRVVAANWNTRSAAVLASAVTLLLPVGLYTICTSNLTNSFGQSMFGIGLTVLLGAHMVSARRWVVTGVGAACVCAGFLSHFSTFSVGVPLLLACAAALFLGRDAPRRTAIAVTLALVLAATTSIAVYYSHFIPVYTRTAERVLAKEGEAQDRSMVAPFSVKARRIVTTVWTEFGAAVLLAAAVGGVMLVRARASDPLTLAVAGWTAVVAGFWLLGIATAIEMRANLAAQPLLAVLAALAIARGGQKGRWLRAAAAVAMAALMLHAVSDWVACLGVAPFWSI